MTVAALPPAPNSITDTRQQFQSKADALLSQLVNQTVSEMNATAAAASTSEINAASSAAQAAAAAAVKNTDNYKGLWSSATTYAQGQSVKYNGEYWLSNINSNLNNAPAEGANWSRVYRLVTTHNTVSGSTNLVSMNAYTTTGGGSFPLPATPSVGEVVGVRKTTDAAVYITRNGNNIEGKARDVPLAVKRRWLWLMYVGGTEGWVDANDSELLAAQTPIFVDVQQIITLGSTIGGVSKLQAITLDADRTLLLMGGSALYGVVYNEQTGVFGTPVLVRNANVLDLFCALKTSVTDQVFVLSCVNGTGTGSAVVLSIAGTTITVGTAAGVTIASGAMIGGTHIFSEPLLMPSGSIVVGYSSNSPAAYIHAVSISGTTPTVGTGAVQTASFMAPILYDMGSGVCLSLNAAANTLYGKPYTVSGSTLTPGTESASAIGDPTNLVTTQFASGRVGALVYYTAATSLRAAVFSVSGTVASVSAINASGTVTNPTLYMKTVGNQAIFAYQSGGAGGINVLTDNAGTAVLGTEIVPNQILGSWGGNASELWLDVSHTSRHGLLAVGISGNNPVVTAAIPMYGNTGEFPVGGQSRKMTYPSQMVTNPNGWTGMVDTLPASGDVFITNGRELRRIPTICFDYNKTCRGADDSQLWGVCNIVVNSDVRYAINRIRSL
jgi:hypothetical protein